MFREQLKSRTKPVQEIKARIRETLPQLYSKHRLHSAINVCEHALRLRQIASLLILRKWIGRVPRRTRKQKE
jgi:hypothetical protein